MKEVASESLDIFKRVIKLVILLLILIIVCIICKYTIMQQIQNIDETVFSFFRGITDDALTVAMKFITFFGSEYIFIPLTICLLIGLKDKRYGMFMAFNLIWVYVLNYILKHIFLRPRPVSLLVSDVSGYSFPSSHAMCSVAFYGLLCVLVCTTFKSKMVKRLFVALTVVLIFLISFSRLYLQVHYLSDVIMGLVFGGLCLLIFISVIRAIDEERRANLESVDKK